MSKFSSYVVESWDEVKNKVTWPKYNELQSSAIMVLIASTIFSLIIGGIDWVFNEALTWFYSGF